MTTDPTHEEIQELLGAYALDAVDGSERDLVELHLRECPRCRAEVAEHREVAALLAHGGQVAPEGLWDRIAEALEEPPPQLRVAVDGPGATVLPFDPASVSGPATAPAMPAAGFHRVRAAVLGAAAAALIVVLGVVAVRLNDRVDDLERDRSAKEVATAALADPDSRRGMLELHDGAVTVPAAITDDGTGFLLAGGTPSLGDGLVYQLWGVHGDEMISLGTFSGGADVVTFSVDRAITALAVTEERAPGVPTPEHEPVGLIEL